MTAVRLPLPLLVFLAACGGSADPVLPIEPMLPSGVVAAQVDGGSPMDMGETDGPSGLPTVTCSGALTGQISATISSCQEAGTVQTSATDGTWFEVFFDNLHTSPKVNYSFSSMSYRLSSVPHGGESYTLDSVVTGRATAVEQGGTAPYWWCGYDLQGKKLGTMQLTIAQIGERSSLQGTTYYDVHGHIDCTYVSAEMPPLPSFSATLTF